MYSENESVEAMDERMPVKMPKALGTTMGWPDVKTAHAQNVSANDAGEAQPSGGNRRAVNQTKNQMAATHSANSRGVTMPMPSNVL